MPLDPVLLYKIAPKGAGSALTLRRTFIKARASVLEHAVSLSKTVSRAAQPRRNPRVFVVVRRFAAVGSPVARLLLFAS